MKSQKLLLKFIFLAVISFGLGHLSGCSTGSKIPRSPESKKEEKESTTKEQTLETPAKKLKHKTKKPSMKREALELPKNGESKKSPELKESYDKEHISIAPGISKRESRKTTIPTSPGLKAGFADDNKQFNHFIKFIQTYQDRVISYPLNVHERIILNLLDQQGKSIPNASVDVYANSEKLCSGQSYSNGSFLFFPSEYNASFSQFRFCNSLFTKLRLKFRLTVTANASLTCV